MLPESRRLKILLLVGVIAVALIFGVGTWRIKGIRSQSSIPLLAPITALA
ncbi:MAG TPA: hypothetical protein VFC80_04055 [Sphaerochaeta sp.]|nr:hypothetical protein [Sphaerochaeta sp.]